MTASAYAYYPGCSLHGTALEYAASTERVCSALGIELREIPDWNCCGASSAHAVNPWLGHGLVGRNLRLVEKTGLRKLAVPCAACYARFKDTQHALRDAATAARVDEVTGAPVPRNVVVEPLLGILAEPERLEAVRRAVRRPLGGLRLAPYYGCLLTRPPDVTGFDDAEDPVTLDSLLAALGATVVAWPGKTSCCGAGLAVTQTETVLDLSSQILRWAEEAGADAIATACPMCHSNLDARQGQMRRAGKGNHAMPVYYLTELVGFALGLDAAELGIGRHLTEATALLSRQPGPAAPAGARG